MITLSVKLNVYLFINMFNIYNVVNIDNFFLFLGISLIFGSAAFTVSWAYFITQPCNIRIFIIRIFFFG